MPTSPDTTRYLNQEQKGIAIYRVAENKSGIHDSRFKWSQFKEALLDVRLYMFFLGYASICVTNGGITSYSSQIIKEFNFSNEDAALLGMAQGFAEVVAIFMGAAIFAWCNRRDIPSMLGLIIAVVGSIMMVSLGADKIPSRMAGTYLSQSFLTTQAFVSSPSFLYQCPFSTTGKVCPYQEQQNDSYSMQRFN